MKTNIAAPAGNTAGTLLTIVRLAQEGISGIDFPPGTVLQTVDPRASLARA